MNTTEKQAESILFAFNYMYNEWGPLTNEDIVFVKEILKTYPIFKDDYSYLMKP